MDIACEGFKNKLVGDLQPTREPNAKEVVILTSNMYLLSKIIWGVSFSTTYLII